MEPRKDPELKPDVPAWAEKMDILPHIRHQFQPAFLNAIGAPDIYGPKHYLGIDIRCPICKKIQNLGPPGKEQRCTGCQFYWLYTAAKGNCFLWIWRAKKKLVLSEKPSEPENNLPVRTVQGSETHMQDSSGDGSMPKETPKIITSLDVPIKDHREAVKASVEVGPSPLKKIW